MGRYASFEVVPLGDLCGVDVAHRRRGARPAKEIHQPPHGMSTARHLRGGKVAKVVAANRLITPHDHTKPLSSLLDGAPALPLVAQLTTTAVFLDSGRT